MVRFVMKELFIYFASLLWSLIFSLLFLCHILAEINPFSGVNKKGLVMLWTVVPLIDFFCLTWLEHVTNVSTTEGSVVNFQKLCHVITSFFWETVYVECTGGWSKKILWLNPVYTFLFSMRGLKCLDKNMVGSTFLS